MIINIIVDAGKKRVDSVHRFVSGIIQGRPVCVCVCYYSSARFNFFDLSLCCVLHLAGNFVSRFFFLGISWNFGVPVLQCFSVLRDDLKFFGVAALVGVVDCVDCRSKDTKHEQRPTGCSDDVGNAKSTRWTRIGVQF